MATASFKWDHPSVTVGGTDCRFNPCRTDTDNNMTNAYRVSIFDLPDEVMFAVFRLLDVFELMPFSRVCKWWRWLIDDSRLRKVLDFGSEYPCVPELHISPMLFNAPLLYTFKVANLKTPVVNRVITVLAENCPHLSVLELARCCNIYAESWQVFGTVPWPRLTHLSLPMCRIDNHILATILPTVRQVTALNIAMNFGVTDDGILCIAERAPALRCLLLHLITNVTHASTVPLLDAVGSHLTQLSLSAPDRALLSALPTACVRLRVLALDLVDSPIDAVGGCLQRLTHLTHLRLSGFCYGLATEALHGFFDVTHEGLSKLEHLAWVGGPVDDRVLEDIAQTCGSHLLYISIIDSTCPFTAVGLTEVASRCTAIEHLELDLYSSPQVTSDIAKIAANMPHLRVFAYAVEHTQMGALKDELAAIIPNVLVCSRYDLYHRAQYRRWRLGDISSTTLQYVQ